MRTELADYGKMVSANYSDMQRFLEQTSTDTGFRLDWNRGEMAAARREFGEVQQIVRNFAREHSITEAQAAQVLTQAHLGVNLGIAGAEVRIHGLTEDKVQDLWKDALSTVRNTQYGRHWQAAVDAGHRAAAEVSRRTGDALAGELASGLAEQVSHRHAVTAAVSEAEAWQRARSRVEE